MTKLITTLKCVLGATALVVPITCIALAANSISKNKSQLLTLEEKVIKVANDYKEKEIKLIAETTAIQKEAKEQIKIKEKEKVMKDKEHKREIEELKNYPQSERDRVAHITLKSQAVTIIEENQQLRQQIQQLLQEIKQLKNK